MFENRGMDTTDATLFVRGFPKTWGQQELLGYFAKFGRVLHGKVLYGRVSGDPTQTGFIQFHLSADAKAVLAFHQYAPAGITLERQFTKERFQANREKNDRESFLFGGNVNGMSFLELETFFLSIVNREIRECRVEYGKGFVKFCTPEAANDALKVASILPNEMEIQKLFPN